MKNTNKHLKIGVLALMAGLYSAGIIAASTTGDADAVIVAPIVLTPGPAMNFGSIAAAPTGGGNSTISVDNSGGLSVAGNALIMSTTGAAPLKFDISGYNASYTITYTDGTLINGTGGTMNVHITGDDSASVSLSSTAQTITAVGDLSVAESQQAGNYSTTGGGTPITITANYN